MNGRFLEIDVRLLVLRYGRQRVIQALARLGEQTVEELEQQLRTAEQTPKAKRPKRSILDLVALESRERPDIAEPLRALAVAYENRTFLPNMREVRRFLERVGASERNPRSRAAAAPVLIRTLAGLTGDELLRLGAEERSGGESDYSLLARAIMGRPATKPNELTEPRLKPTKS